MRFWFLLLAGCTQDFSVFEPVEAQAPPQEAGSDATVSDAAVAADTTSVDSAPVACTEPSAVMYGGHCYFPLVGGAFSYIGGQQTCQVKGAHLVTITSSGESDAVKPIDSGNERWIGLARPQASPAQDSSYVWITGEPRGSFSNWSAGEPNGSGASVRLTGTGSWADNPGTDNYDAICERE